MNDNNEVLVRVENVSKKFCRSLKKSLWYGVKDMAHEINPFGGAAESRKQKAEINHNAAGQDKFQLSTFPISTLRDGEFWAVNNVSFELKRGECLGLIGRNGAGKTTLLKMLNGLIKPDHGRIEMRGRIGALIALGAGFNPILTGRENIYVNGSVLGFTRREIDEQIPSIIDFAEIGDFIDSPVQSYSSGMQVRLGFSIASSLAPDVLILDEVLAVGDVNFVIKCLNRMRVVAANAAVIFVSHNMQFISSFCTRTIVMKGGRVIVDANTPEGIDCYNSMIEHANHQSGSGEAQLHGFRMFHDSGRPLGTDELVKQGEPVTVELDISIQGPRQAATVGIHILDQGMTSQVMSFPLRTISGKVAALPPGRHRLKVPLGPLELNAGKYSFMVGISDVQSKVVLLRLQGVCPFKIYAEGVSWSHFIRPVDAVECTRIPAGSSPIQPPSQDALQKRGH